MALTDLDEDDLKRLRSLSSLEPEDRARSLDASTEHSQGSDPLLAFRAASSRKPFVFTCREWLSSQRLITMWINPTAVTISMGERAVVQKTPGGFAIHQSLMRGRDTTYDTPKLSFRLHTGNTLPTEYRNDSDVRRLLAPGLVNLYDFVELKGQSKITEGGEPNFVYCVYNSPLYPNMTLTGFFDPGELSIEDDSENPFSKTYNVDFLVSGSTPRFDKPQDLIRAFQADGIEVNPNVPR